MRSIAGLEKMTGVAAEGYASITLEFLAGENMDLALDDVREAIDKAKSDLPEKADEPVIYEISLSIVAAFLIFSVPLSTLFLIALPLLPERW